MHIYNLCTKVSIHFETKVLFLSINAKNYNNKDPLLHIHTHDNLLKKYIQSFFLFFEAQFFLLLILVG